MMGVWRGLEGREIDRYWMFHVQAGDVEVGGKVGGLEGR